MKKQYLYFIIGSCFYLSALGQEKTTNSNTILNPYSIQKTRNKSHQSLKKRSQRSLKSVKIYKEKLDSIIDYNYNEVSDAWDIKFTKESYAYDENLNEVLWVYSAWSTNDSNWKNLLKEESQYNEHNNITVNSKFIWSHNKWNKDSKWVYTYNQNDELIQKLTYQWKYNLNDWLLIEKWDYSYNAQGKPLKDSLYWRYANSQEWKLQKKIDYKYINDKELHYIFYSNWDSNTNQWIASKKKWYLYDLQWRLINLSSYEWDDTKDSNWKLTNRKYYGYDDNDYLNEYADINIKPRNDGYVQHQIMFETNEYDFSLMFNDILLPNHLNNQELKFHHKLLNTSIGQHNYDTKQEEQYRERKLYYSPIDVLGTKNHDILLKDVSIYPIPAKDYITIKFLQNDEQGVLKLYTLNGEKIYDNIVFNNTMLNISHIQSGIYLYKLIIGKKTKTGKLIID